MSHDEPVTIGLLGRSNSETVDPTYHCFGQVSSDPTRLFAFLSDPRDAVQGGAALVRGQGENTFRIRRIRSSGIEVVRESQADAAPLTQSEIERPQPGCQGAPNFSLLVSAQTREGMTQFRMDVGCTLDLLCGKVDVQICGPNAVTIGTAGSDAELAGVIVDARIGVAVSCIETADGGHRRVPFTELWGIPNSTTPALPIPANARALKVKMALGAAAASWTLYADDPTLGNIPVGDVAFDAGGTYSLDETADVTGARYLVPDSVASDRGAQLTWQIEP